MENELKPCAYNEKLVRLKDINDALTAQFMDSPLDSDRWVIGRIQFRVNDVPAVDAVPMDFHDRCMQTEIRKRLELERFVKWVMDEIFSENWEYNRIAFDELACRKLVKMGYVAVDEENDLYYRKDEPENG